MIKAGVYLFSHSKPRTILTIKASKLLCFFGDRDTQNKLFSFISPFIDLRFRNYLFDLQVNQIEVNIELYNILHVDVVESRIETQFELKLSW